jgi:hypothetical protein
MYGRAILMSTLSLLTPYLVVASAVASADELKPYSVRTIALESTPGTIFFKPDGLEFDVVATVNSDGHPIRLIAPLRPGQGLALSAPTSIGAPTTIVVIRRDGDTLSVVDHPSSDGSQVSPSDVDLSSGP